MSFSPRGCAHPVSGRARPLRVCWPPSAPLVRGPAVRTVGTIRTAPGLPCQVRARCMSDRDSNTDASAPPARAGARRPAISPLSRPRRTRRPRGSIDRSATVARIRAYAVAHKKNIRSKFDDNPIDIKPVTAHHARPPAAYNVTNIRRPILFTAPARARTGSARPRTLIDFLSISQKTRLTSRVGARRRGSQQRVWAVSRPRRRTVPRTGRGS